MGEVNVIVRRPGERPIEKVIASGVSTICLGNLRALKLASGSLAAGNINAFAFAWQNPELVSIIVLEVVIDITTAGGAAGVLDVGTAANATTHSDNLLDGITHNAIDKVTNLYETDAGTNGRPIQVMDAKDGATDYITAQILTAAAASLAGSYYILYTEV